jgi:hypothetical protein
MIILCVCMFLLLLLGKLISVDTSKGNLKFHHVDLINLAHDVSPRAALASESARHYVK